MRADFCLELPSLRKSSYIFSFLIDGFGMGMAPSCHGWKFPLPAHSNRRPLPHSDGRASTVLDQRLTEFVVVVRIVGEHADRRAVALVPCREAVVVIEQSDAVVAVTPRVVLHGGIADR